ncbi:putative transport protein YdiK [compost metagenome]|uniref:Predicted PurR-regulated permease PerM n=1 Tax=Pseudomonas jinjuensis TaxID=198616 RepID=A0A1H0D4G1_9PSED|nr:AI-2E family transporter [Pseudomonas jinjuensis]SDN64979.1 Predicted PurR-regulated permease PerM [Pseudomonas jinjuensis]
MQPNFKLDSNLSRGLLDIFIKAGLIAALVIFSFQVFQPFLELMLWSVILAVTMYPLLQRLKRRPGLRDGHAATLIVLVALLILIAPIYLMVMSITESLESTVALLRSGTWRLPAPPDAVAGWPLIGPQLHGFWLGASSDLTDTLHKLLPHLKGSGRVLLGALASLGATFLMFIAAMIIAGIIMAFGENGERSSLRIATRISGAERGPRIVALCSATIRAVAQGVVGIAFIQMLLIGVGFVVKGVPAAGMLAIAVLLLGIVQLPATLITVPVIAYVFATEGFTAATIVFAIYTFVAGLADNVLKPLLLGRGVDVPMPVVLIGALGGMVVKGVIGLFIGPVILAVAYNLFWQWVDDQVPDVESDTGEQG